MVECAVLYLDRWGNPPNAAHAFLSSLSRFDAGAEYDFIYMLKGYPAEKQRSHPLNDFRRDVNPKTHVLPISDDRFATASILQAAKAVPHEKIIFFISWCRILAPQWLKFYLNAFDAAESCGIAGATSGYERSNYKDETLPFPNIGIRTTSFLMDRKMFIEMADGKLASREQELAFESGPDGLTKQIMRRGLKPVVVDNKGKIWHTEQWPRSHTFRAGYQEGLLVADNRTYDYDAAKPKRRRFLADITWGAGVAEAPPISYYRRLKARVEWSYGNSR
jgi:hypothetical protein